MNIQNPELQRLLANLKGTTVNTIQNTATISSSNDVFHLGPNNDAHMQNSQPPQIPGLGFLPFEDVHSQIPQRKTAAPTTDPRARHSQTLPQKQDGIRSQTSTPVLAVPDASTITTWPAALKHVTKHILSSTTTTTAIKRLISTQHTHEETWHKQREEILVRHASRAGNSTKVSNLLAELGGLAIPITKVDKAAEKNELESFDRKVYKNLVAMSRDCDKELRRLGVPFFAIKHDLVDVSEDGKGAEGKLDKGELRDLQRRIVQYLEDLLVD